MRSRTPLRLFLFFSSSLALAAACGGRTVTGIGGTNSGDGGNGSSGGGSGGISGSSGGGSGGISGSSGGSSGGGYCEPLPGCNSAYECPSPYGCGVCYCEGGGWECGGEGCGDDEADASLPDGPSYTCPAEPPGDGSYCGASGLVCGYGSNEGCGEQCSCEGDYWSCYAEPCPPPVCPPEPPYTGQGCFDVGTCYYPTNGCGDIECDCNPAGFFDCYDPFGCADAGPPDEGPPDAGGCPQFVPPDNEPCPNTQGMICSYFTGCETNCLCAPEGWVCAESSPCSGGSSGGSSSSSGGFGGSGNSGGSSGGTP